MRLPFIFSFEGKRFKTSLFCLPLLSQAGNLTHVHVPTCDAAGKSRSGDTHGLGYNVNVTLKLYMYIPFGAQG